MNEWVNDWVINRWYLIFRLLCLSGLSVSFNRPSIDENPKSPNLQCSTHVLWWHNCWALFRTCLCYRKRRGRRPSKWCMLPSRCCWLPALESKTLKKPLCICSSMIYGRQADRQTRIKSQELVGVGVLAFEEKLIEIESSKQALELVRTGCIHRCSRARLWLSFSYRALLQSIHLRRSEGVAGVRNRIGQIVITRCAEHLG